MKHQGQNTPIIKTHIAKLEMMKHQGQNTPIKMIQKTQKQTKLLQFPTLCLQMLLDDEVAKSIIP